MAARLSEDIEDMMKQSFQEMSAGGTESCAELRQDS